MYVFAIAPHDLGVDGGVLVTVRSASREWPSADKILRSLKVFGRRPVTANDARVPRRCCRSSATTKSPSYSKITTR